MIDVWYKQTHRFCIFFKYLQNGKIVMSSRGMAWNIQRMTFFDHQRVNKKFENHFSFLRSKK
jgi:hypothetical protein